MESGKMKKILTLAVLFMLFGFFTANAQQMIQSGKFSVNGDTPGYTLDKNTGDRSLTIEVTFLTPLETKPEIVLSIIGFDADKTENLRYSIEAKSVSRDGFTIKINTWGASKIYGLTGNWLAHTK